MAEMELKRMQQALDTKMRELKHRERVLRDKETQWTIMRRRLKANALKAQTVVTLDLRGKTFRTHNSTLLRTEGSYFYAMLTSGDWLPDRTGFLIMSLMRLTHKREFIRFLGTYFIDRKNDGFDRVLEYMSSGELDVRGLNDYEIEAVKEHLDYFGLLSMKNSTTSSKKLKSDSISLSTQLQLKLDSLERSFKAKQEMRQKVNQYSLCY